MRRSFEPIWLQNMVHIRLQSTFRLETCIELLKNATTPDRYILSDFGLNHAILCRESGSGLRMRVRRSMWTRNDFRPICHLEFREIPQGTEIKIRSAVHPVTKVFMRIWFGFIIIGYICFLIHAIAAALHIPGAQWDKNEWLGLVVPAVLLAFGGGLVWFGHWMGAADEEEIVELVEYKLQATRLDKFD